jgi:hypothetical protein
MLIWIADITLWERYVLDSPRTPSASQGRAIAVNYKSGPFYVEKRWRDWDAALNLGAWLLAVIATLGGVLFDRAGRRAWSKQNHGACPGCMGQDPMTLSPRCKGTGFAGGDEH